MKLEFNETGGLVLTTNATETAKLVSSVGLLHRLKKDDGPTGQAADAAYHAVSRVLALLRGEVVEAPKE